MNNKTPISLKIVVYSYNSLLLTNAINILNSLAKVNEVHAFSTYIVPRNIKKITVNRSPHIDKKSREQFKMVNYRYVLEWEINSQQKLLNLIHSLKHNILPKMHGVSLKLDFNFTTHI